MTTCWVVIESKSCNGSIQLAIFGDRQAIDHSATCEAILAVLQYCSSAKKPFIARDSYGNAMLMALLMDWTNDRGYMGDPWLHVPQPQVELRTQSGGRKTPRPAAKTHGNAQESSAGYKCLTKLLSSRSLAATKLMLSHPIIQCIQTLRRAQVNADLMECCQEIGFCSSCIHI